MAERSSRRWLLIAPVAWDRERPGGIETFFRQLVRELVTAGEHVTVLCSAPKGSTMAEGTRVFGVGEGRSPSELGFMFRVIVNRGHLAALRNRNAIAVVNSEHLVLAARVLTGKTVLISHGPTAPALAARSGRWLGALYGALVEPIAVSLTLIVLAISRSSLEYFSNRYARIGDKVRGGFLPAPRVLSEADVGSLPMPDHNLCLVGRLSREKRVDLAVRAWPLVRDRIPRAELLIIGSGPEESRLRNLVADLGAPGVSFLGALSRRHVVSRLSRSRGLLIVSEREVFPTVILEALALGKPVITTRVGDALPLIDDSTGAVVEATPASIAEASVRILSSTEDEMRKYAVSAVSRVHALSWERFLREFRIAVDDAVQESDA